MARAGGTGGAAVMYLSGRAGRDDARVHLHYAPVRDGTTTEGLRVHGAPQAVTCALVAALILRGDAD